MELWVSLILPLQRPLKRDVQKKNPLGTKLALVIYAGLSTDSYSWRVCIIIDVATAEIPQERCTTCNRVLALLGVELYVWLLQAVEVDV